MKITYHPLICVNRTEKIYSPLFPSENKEQMKYFDYYLMRISKCTFTLCSNTPKSFSDYKDFRITCPLCGKTLERFGLATNHYILSPYMCGTQH